MCQILLVIIRLNKLGLEKVANYNQMLSTH